MESLPDEAIQQIFSTLSARDLLHAIWTCSAWRHVLQANQDWWQAWYQRRCPNYRPQKEIDPTHQDEVPAGGWQQRTLTRGLHMPWRFKPVTSRRLLYYGLGRQDGWTRRGHPPAVLVEGDWALLTCTPNREGPTGGRDRLQLIKLDTLSRQNEKERARNKTARKFEQHWLDFGTNKYKPYALQGGATDLHMPFVVQGRASDVVLWKANQQYPVAVLHQAHGITVPAVAIERSPWGQQPQAEALRLVSCSDTGKVSVWQMELASHTLSESTPVWEGQASDICGKPGKPCKVDALTMWTLSRSTQDGRNSCYVAIGTDRLGVALLFITFHQHGPKGIKSLAIRLLTHTAPVLSMCVAWDYTPPVCPFPASSSCASAASPHEEELGGAAAVDQGPALQHAPAGGLGQAGIPGAANGPGGLPGHMQALFGGGFLGGLGGNQHFNLGNMAGGAMFNQPLPNWGAALGMGGHPGGLWGDADASTSEQAESSTADQQSTATDTQQSSPNAQAAQRLSDNSLAASCDRTHLYVIWGLTPLPPPLAQGTPPLSEPNSRHRQPAEGTQYGCQAAQHGSAAGSTSFSQTDASAFDDSAQTPPAAQNTDHNLSDRDSVLRHGDFRGLTGPDDLVTSLRRLRPHLHAAGPFSSQSTGATGAKGALGPSGAGNRSLLPTEGVGTSRFAAPRTDAAAGRANNPDAVATAKNGLDEDMDHVSKVARCDGKQESDTPSSGATDDASQCVTPATDTECAHHSALSLATDSTATADMTEGAEPHSNSAGKAQHAQHGTARPPWACLKAACTAQQLKALHQCCCTVACFDVFEQTSDAADHCQGSETEAERSKQGCEEQPPQNQACRARPLWSHPVIAAACLSAGDGAVAVACSDGVLLLLDQASGNLIRRVPNFQLDQRFMEHPKSRGQQKSLAGVNSPWLDPSPVLHCTVWWGHLGSSPAPSDHGLTVVTELPLAHAASRIPQELRIDHYSCAEDDVPPCRCKDGKKTVPAVLRTTVPPQMASLYDVEQQESALQDIQDGVGNPLSNLYGIGVQLPHQHAARRYFTCSHRTAWRSGSCGCTFVEFFD